MMFGAGKNKLNICDVKSPSVLKDNNMKNRSIALVATVISVFSLNAQQTLIFKDPQEKFKEAKEYYQKEQYSLAYPLFKELKQAVRETNYVNYAN